MIYHFSTFLSVPPKEQITDNKHANKRKSHYYHYHHHHQIHCSGVYYRKRKGKQQLLCCWVVPDLFFSLIFPLSSRLHKRIKEKVNQSRKSSRMCFFSGMSMLSGHSILFSVKFAEVGTKRNMLDFVCRPCTPCVCTTT